MSMTAFDELIGETDAQRWAREFVKVAELRPDIPCDEGTMIGWFANAIMAGYDDGARDERSRGIVHTIRELVFLAAGVGSDAVMEEAPDVVMPYTEIRERLHKLLREYGIWPEESYGSGTDSGNVGVFSGPRVESSSDIPKEPGPTYRGSQTVEFKARPDGLLREHRPMEPE
jgi:hypothetical protein